jgi:hypothetical protein
LGIDLTGWSMQTQPLLKQHDLPNVWTVPMLDAVADAVRR